MVASLNAPSSTSKRGAAPSIQKKLTSTAAAASHLTESAPMGRAFYGVCLLEPELRLAHDLARVGERVLHHLAERLRRVADRRRLRRVEALQHFGLLQRCDECRVQARRDLGRQLRRRDKTEPRRIVDEGMPELGEGRDVGKARDAL